MPASGGHPPTPGHDSQPLRTPLRSCDRFKDFATAASNSHTIAAKPERRHTGHRFRCVHKAIVVGRIAACRTDIR